MARRLNQSKVKQMLEKEQNLQYKINQINSLMRTMQHDGYRLTLVDNKTKVAWIKVGKPDSRPAY